MDIKKGLGYRKLKDVIKKTTSTCAKIVNVHAELYGQTYLAKLQNQLYEALVTDVADFLERKDAQDFRNKLYMGLGITAQTEDSDEKCCLEDVAIVLKDAVRDYRERSDMKLRTINLILNPNIVYEHYIPVDQFGGYSLATLYKYYGEHPGTTSTSWFGEEPRDPNFNRAMEELVEIGVMKHPTDEYDFFRRGTPNSYVLAISITKAAIEKALKSQAYPARRELLEFLAEVGEESETRAHAEEESQKRLKNKRATEFLKSIGHEDRGSGA